MEQFLLELGVGFAFVARQKRIVIDGEDFYLDLLFYHRRLRRLVAVELKLGSFQAADKGQMELYLRWLEKYETEPGEETPLGLILCADKGGRAGRAAPARPERDPGRVLPDRAPAEAAAGAEAPRFGPPGAGTPGGASRGTRGPRVRRDGFRLRMPLARGGVRTARGPGCPDGGDELAGPGREEAGSGPFPPSGAEPYGG